MLEIGKDLCIMNQIVVKRVFNKDAFIPGHPYAILTQTKTVYGLFSHYENETTLDFIRLQKAASGNDYVPIYTDLIISVNDIDSGDIKSIMPMTISDTSEDTLGNEDLEIFDGDVDVQSAVIDAIQDTDNVYDSYSETETLDYPVSEYAREVHQSSDDLQKQYEQRENSIAAPDESEEEIADDDLFDDDADK